MDTERIVQGVLSSIDTLGPVPPSARRLAGRLHIAPATLYSSVPSLFDAYGQARSVVAEEIAEPLVMALCGESANSLVGALLESPNRSAFVTDPSWQLPDTERLANARGGTDVTHDAMIDGLALIGSLFSVDSLAAEPPSPQDIEDILAIYRHAVQAGPTATVPASAIDEVRRDAIEIIRAQDLNAGDENVQVKSLELIANNISWSFRALREQTELAVSRLHRYGSRIDHMARAYVALGTAAAKWTDHNVEPGENFSTRLALLLHTGAPDVAAELEHLRRCDPSGRASAHGQKQIDAIIGRPSVALVTAQRSRGIDDATVAGIGAAVGANNLYPLAA